MLNKSGIGDGILKPASIRLDQASTLRLGTKVVHMDLSINTNEECAGEFYRILLGETLKKATIKILSLGKNDGDFTEIEFTVELSNGERASGLISGPLKVGVYDTCMELSRGLFERGTSTAR